MKKRASLFLCTSLVLITAAAVDARAQTPPPGYEPPPGYQPQQQYPQQQYPQQQPAPGYYQRPAPGYAPAPVPAPMRRMGFFGGLSLGGGAMAMVADNAQGDSVGGIAYSGHIGFMLAPRFGLLIEGSGISGSIDDGYGGSLYQSHTMGLIGAQLFLTDWIWARGGIGGGTLSFSDDIGTYEEHTGASVMLAAGVEFLKAGGVTMDVHGRWAYTAFDGFGVSNLALQVGINWYSLAF